MIRRAEGQSSVKVGAGLGAREILGPKPGSAADVCGALGVLVTSLILASASSY